MGPVAKVEPAVRSPEAAVADIVRMLSPGYTENKVLYELATGETHRFP